MTAEEAVITLRFSDQKTGDVLFPHIYSIVNVEPMRLNK